MLPLVILRSVINPIIVIVIIVFTTEFPSAISECMLQVGDQMLFFPRGSDSPSTGYYAFQARVLSTLSLD
jgi:hypothetical protein